jgi:hypothetical protein
MRFKGISSIDELDYVLNGYDIDSEWPKGSGISYLRYFALDDFERGARLANFTETLWSSFVALLPTNSSPRRALPVEIPMEHVARTIEQLLRRVAMKEEWGVVTERKSWLEMIEKTGFTNHMRKIMVPT